MNNSELYIFGKGFNYSEDGPGNRLVYHLCGCNLTCPWCSNPDGLSVTSDAKRMTVEELLEESLSCQPMFFDGGGVTLTGGEVCVQSEAAALLLAKLRQNHIHTAVETNASLPGFFEVSRSTDYLIADFKHPDEEKLFSVTGAKLSDIKANLQSRVLSGEALHIRTTLVHGFNDDEDSLNGLIEYFTYLAELNRVCELTFELLRYHEFGKEKWLKLGREYSVSDGFVSDDTYNHFSSCIKEHNINLINT